MSFRATRLVWFCLISATILVGPLQAQESSSSRSPKHVKKPPEAIPDLNSGTVVGSVYRNSGLALSCKIPAGWVLRTEEMNAREEQGAVAENDGHPAPHSPSGCPQACSKVLLAAFSRPPEARGEDVNSSILIAAESQSGYPGLKDAAQYFGPLTEVAKAQGFTIDEEPYEIALGSKSLVRGDFHKDVGTRVMRQSTLAFLERGYAVSITVIGGTEDEVEELIDGVSFGRQ